MESLEEIKLRSTSKDPEQRIDALLDAWEYGTAGVELVIDALEDPVREVRQSALLLLSESEAEIAKQALWNYLPFSQMQCLHTITEFNLDCPSSEYSEHHHHFKNLAIASYNDTLLSYWILPKYSCLHVWNLATGKSIKCLDSKTNYFALSQNGTEAIFNWYECLNVASVDNLDWHDTRCDTIIKNSPSHNAFAVCLKATLVAIGHADNIISETKTIGIGTLEIIDYKTDNYYLYYAFEGLLATHYVFDRVDEGNSWKNYISPLLFTPSDEILIAHFIPNRLYSLVKLWNVYTGELVQTLENLPKLTITSVGVSPNGTIMACGIREEKVCAWELQSDRIIYTALEVSPCILSTDGRVLIYATAKHEIIVRDLVADRELVTLQGHDAPIAYLVLSEDRQFLASN